LKVIFSSGYGQIDDGSNPDVASLPKPFVLEQLREILQRFQIAV
jgi:hypothetical protein